MKFIFRLLQHNFDFHMDHNSDTGNNIIGSIFKSDKVVFRWREIDMHSIINGDELWILWSCKADTHNSNLYSNIQYTECQTEPDLAAAPAAIVETAETAVAALIKIPGAGPRAVTAAMIIKAVAPVDVRLTPMKLANNSTNPGAIRAVTRPRDATRWVIAMTMMMNHVPHVKGPTY